MRESLKNKTVKGTVWSSIERFSVQGIAFVVMIVMARVLTPKDYGLVGMVAVFTAVSQSLVDSGFSQAIIRKQDRSETDNSTVFYFNIAVGVFLYLILYFCAPLIADFYNEPILIPITRIISLSIIINSFAVVQRALLTVEIDFKTQAKASLSASVIAGAIGIYMTYSGYGVWSIVWYQVSNFAVNVVLLWVFSKWRPQLKYSWKSFRVLFGFGSKLALSGIIDTIYRNLYLIVIGKVFRPADLGYYTRAEQFASFPSSNLTGILQRVTFPVLCTIQDDDERLQTIYRRFLRVSAYLVFPFMMGLAAVSKPLILVVLKDQWLFSASLLSILCFAMMWYPIHSINLNLLMVKGRSDLFLKLEIIKKVLGVTMLCFTLPFGLIWMCTGMIANSLIALAINTHYTGKLIQVGFFTQLKDLFPILVLSIGTGIAVFLTIQGLPSPEWMKLTIGIIEGIAIYLTFSKMFNFPELSELITIIKRK